MKPGKGISFTEQEMNVLLLSRQGLGRNRIAKALGVKPGRIKQLVAQVKKKLELPNGADTTAMVQKTRELGIIH